MCIAFRRVHLAQQGLAQRGDLQVEGGAGLHHVAQGARALLAGVDLHLVAVEEAAHGGLTGLARQDLQRFGCEGLQRVGRRDALRHVEQPARRVEVARFRCAQQIAGLAQRVEQVRAAAVGQIEKARHFRIRQGTAFPRIDFEDLQHTLRGRENLRHRMSELSGEPAGALA
ncbi:hypothetical protein G6F31_019106 [Rhizopus arrhizus]|nr:hypothetical protein G6F31_019106 [Rhizopus arrhizus]